MIIWIDVHTSLWRVSRGRVTLLPLPPKKYFYKHGLSYFFQRRIIHSACHLLRWSLMRGEKVPSEKKDGGTGATIPDLFQSYVCIKHITDFAPNLWALVKTKGQAGLRKAFEYTMPSGHCQRENSEAELCTHTHTHIYIYIYIYA